MRSKWIVYYFCFLHTLPSYIRLSEIITIIVATSTDTHVTTLVY